MRRGFSHGRYLLLAGEREHFQLGVTGGEHAEYDSLWRLYARPVAKAGALLIGRGAGARVVPRLEGEG